MQYIITVLEIASIYRPDEQQILKNMIEVLQTLMKEYTDKNTFRTVLLTADSYNDMANKIQEVKKKLQQLDPKYNIEVPSYNKSCFIATAAYGSPMAPDVIMLREFRDHFLETTHWGQTLVKIYYYLSPPVALLISKSDRLGAITRFLLKPIVYLIKRLRIKPT
jgi:hypothetical protein